MSAREQRAAIARETLAIVAAGRYVNGDGRSVEMAAAVRACVASTRLVAAEEPVDPGRAPGVDTVFEVRNESALAALARRVASGNRQVGVLNFASARHPGGGFQRGAEAQEEALARSSALHASLTSPAAAPFYRHDAPLSSLYTDRVIVSPGCPVFRGADGGLLPEALPATFLTCAAPNATALRANEPQLEAQLPETFERRVARVLGVAAQAGCDALVLGAWGCGVFGNDPHLVAGVFARHLRGAGAFARRFSHVDFAVPDSSPATERWRAFERAFAQEMR